MNKILTPFKKSLRNTGMLKDVSLIQRSELVSELLLILLPDFSRLSRHLTVPERQ